MSRAPAQMQIAFSVGFVFVLFFSSEETLKSLSCRCRTIHTHSKMQQTNQKRKRKANRSWPLTSAVEWFGYRAFINWCRQYRTATTWKWNEIVQTISFPFCNAALLLSPFGNGVCPTVALPRSIAVKIVFPFTTFAVAEQLLLCSCCLLQFIRELFQFDAKPLNRIEFGHRALIITQLNLF